MDFRDLIERLSSRKFLLSLAGLVLVVMDVAAATDVAIVLGPFVGLEGISDAVDRQRKATKNL